jgi:hypothetical protein
MFSALRHLLERLGAAKARQAEEDYFQHDLDSLDKESPGWDESVRVEEARLRLKQGLSRQQVAAVYGARILEAALHSEEAESRRQEVRLIAG